MDRETSKRQFSATLGRTAKMLAKDVHAPLERIKNVKMLQVIDTALRKALQLDTQSSV